MATFTSVQNRIKELRTRAGFTQADLAERVGVSRQTIIAIEQDRYTPSLALAFDLARTFDQTVEQVFTR